MVTFKTKTPFMVEYGRVIRTEILYLKVEKLEMDTNAVIPTGYYYFIDETGEAKILSNIKQNAKLWTDIQAAESAILTEMGSTIHLKNNIIQRLGELTMMQIDLEAGENYGTVKTDWEVYVG